MGLDSVEVILGIEEGFDIAIPDEAAAELNTVGRLYAFVLSRLYTDRPTQCMSSLIFYQARRALIDLSGAGRRSIRPSTRMEDLLPAKGRQEHWQNLSRAMGMRGIIAEQLQVPLEAITPDADLVRDLGAD
jgi:acyl carrier protein